MLLSGWLCCLCLGICGGEPARGVKASVEVVTDALLRNIVLKRVV